MNIEREKSNYARLVAGLIANHLCNAANEIGGENKMGEIIQVIDLALSYNTSDDCFIKEPLKALRDSFQIERELLTQGDLCFTS